MFECFKIQNLDMKVHMDSNKMSDTDGIIDFLDDKKERPLLRVIRQAGVINNCMVCVQHIDPLLAKCVFLLIIFTIWALLFQIFSYSIRKTLCLASNLTILLRFLYRINIKISVV